MLGKLGKNVVGSDEVVFVVFEFDRGRSVVRKQNLVADGYVHGQKLSVFVHARSYGDDFGFVHLWKAAVWKEDAAHGLRLGHELLAEDAVRERNEFAGDR